MATTCTVPFGETILKGDAVCVTGYDGGAGRPTVKRASAANLATSKTVFGVAEANAGGGTVGVLVAGEVAKNAITSLGNVGGSRIIATDINAVDPAVPPDPDVTAALQCRLIRVDRPNGSEYVVGTCDENGNLALQPRASHETSPLHVFNVCSYGADPTGVNPSDAAFAAAMAAMDVLDPLLGFKGATLYVPPGTYLLDYDLHVRKVLRLTGAGGTLGDNASTLQFAEGRGLIIDEINSAVVFGGGRGDGATVSDIDLRGARLAALTTWLPNHAYAVGDVVKPDLTATPANATLNQTLATGFHFICVATTGNSAATQPGSPLGVEWPTDPAPPTTRAWAAGVTRRVGDVVVPTGHVNANGRYYECITAGASNTEPAWGVGLATTWNDGPGGVGGAVWRIVAEDARTRTIAAVDAGAWCLDGGVIWMAVAAAGIWIRGGSVSVENTYVGTFTDSGIQVIAGLATAPKTVANSFYIRCCLSQSNGGHGLYIQGSDANGGTSLNFHAQANLGAGVVDGGYLGNVHMSPLTDGNVLEAYRADNAVGHTVFMRPYAEGGQLPSVILNPAVIFGGQVPALSAGSQGLVLLDIESNSPLSSTNARGPTSVVSSLGITDITMTAFAKTTGDDSTKELREKYNRTNGRWEWSWDVFPATMSTCAGRGLPAPGQVVLPLGIIIGAPFAELRLTTGAAAPAAGLWNQGDRVYNTAPLNALDVEGWVCTVKGGWPARAWAATIGGIVVYMGDSIEPSVANGLVYQCTDIAGNNSIGFTDAAVEPIWPLVIGAAIVDGGVTWTCFGPTPPTFRSFGQVN